MAAFSGEHWGERLKGIATYETGVVLRLLRRGRLAGRVIDASSGLPVEHFSIRAAFRRPDGNTFHLKWMPIDHAAGEFFLDGAEPDPVETEIHVRADGYLLARSRPCRVPPGGESEPIEIRIEPGGGLRGSIVDAASGEPVAGARIRSHDRDVFDARLLDTSRDSWFGGALWKLAMSDAEGGFEIGGLQDGAIVHLAIWKEGYGTVVRRAVEVSAGVPPLEVLLEREAVVSVRARFSPASGERLVVSLAHREERPWKAAVTIGAAIGRDGRAELRGLPPGRYRLAIYRLAASGGNEPPRLAGETGLRLAAGERRELDIDLDELARRFGSLSGRISSHPDPRQVLVDIARADDPEEMYSLGPQPCGPDGRFEFYGLPAGRYTVFARDVSADPAVDVRVPATLGEAEHREIEVELRRPFPGQR